MVSLPLVGGGYVSIDPKQVAAVRDIESAGVFDNGKCEVALRGGVTYEINYSAHTVRKKLDC